MDSDGRYGRKNDWMRDCVGDRRERERDRRGNHVKGLVITNNWHKRIKSVFVQIKVIM